MSCDRFLIDINHAFLKSPVHTNTLSFEGASSSMRFRNLYFAPVHTNTFSFENARVFESLHFGNRSQKPSLSVKTSHLFVVLVWTEGNENVPVWTGP